MPRGEAAVGLPLAATSPAGRSKPQPGMLPAAERGQTERIETTGGTVWITPSEPEPALAPATPPEDLADGEPVPDFGAFEQRYAEEPRDAEWASTLEQHTAALMELALGTKTEVRCRQTLCRLEVQTDDPDAFQSLLDAPGLQAETGLSPRSPHALRAGQLAVYFRGQGRAAALGITE